MGGKEAPERIKRAEKKGREQRGKGQATGRQDTQIRYQTGHNPVKGEGGEPEENILEKEKARDSEVPSWEGKKPINTR